MAERPVFIPAPDAPGFVREKSLNITWAGGFAATQKKKNVNALHIAAKAIGIGPVLEASTKSDEKLGQRLSAFHLKVKTADGDLPLECVFQSSKVFERGGPYSDLRFADPRSAKRDPRLRESGRLVAFVFEGHNFPLEPKTVFYDWLYINAIFPHRDWLDRLYHYAAFSDIEFNPQKSINCQARSLALFVSLKATSLLDDAVRSPEAFIEIMRSASRRPAGAVREARTAAIESPAQSEPVAALAATGEPQEILAEPALAAARNRSQMQNNDCEETARGIAAAVTGVAFSDDVSSVSASESASAPSDFKTFLRDKVLRKHTSVARTRRKADMRKPKEGRQTSVFQSASPEGE
jgi:hypothetical protein